VGAYYGVAGIQKTLPGWNGEFLGKTDCTTEFVGPNNLGIDISEVIYVKLKI
jgi:hypothetical protein